MQNMDDPYRDIDIVALKKSSNKLCTFCQHAHSRLTNIIAHLTGSVKLGTRHKIFGQVYQYQPVNDVVCIGLTVSLHFT